MDIFHLKPNRNCPEILFDPSNGQFSIQGVCASENSQRLFQSVHTWLDEYVKKPAKETVLTMNLDYFNTSASKQFYLVLKKLESLKLNGNKIMVKWCYDEWDEDMEKSGQDFQPLFSFDVELVKIPQKVK